MAEPANDLIPLALKLLARLGRAGGGRGVPGTHRLAHWLYPCRSHAWRHWSGVVARRDGLSQWADTRRLIARAVLLDGVYEPTVTALIETVLVSGADAWDVGANVGCHTLTMARCVGPRGRVLSFEPNPRERKELDGNCRRNGLAWVEVVPLGLGEVAGAADLRVPRHDDPNAVNPGLASVVALDTPHDLVPIRIETGDALAARMAPGRLDLVKIDVQGMDAQVIRGMQGLLRRCAPVLVFEYEPWAWGQAGESLGAVMATLAGLGYGLWCLAGVGPGIDLHPIGDMGGDHADLVALTPAWATRLGQIDGVRFYGGFRPGTA